MKYLIDYEILIPSYSCAEDLKLLIGDIHNCCMDYLPKRILIVDDCSDDNDDTSYVGNIFNTAKFPIETIRTERHLGPFYAEQLGLSRIASKYVVVLHSDTRLVIDNLDKYIAPLYVQTERVSRDGSFIRRPRLYKDVISILVCYLYQSQDAAVVSCFSLNNDNVSKISRGTRGIGVNMIPGCHYSSHNFDSLKAADIYFRWQRVLSVDSNIYAMRKGIYDEVGFDEGFAPYYLYHDDFFARCRAKGMHTYLTQDVVAFHPLYSEKPVGSLAMINQQLFDKNAKLFIDRYRDSDLWRISSIKAKEIEGRMVGPPA